eukprot:CAMPEP_0170498246 /NCGR_PEP_ID=MMETSP0208-20121228/27260_1 /TAXON_ID=197538 /ORGANISM="Strombidium inclinatum, Strain S3" /LENGTH=84 /DNA_ID=CAMNT_0010775371 /DNA_START=2135 /DNA_END=2389 /DNA_ORIENTATION=+
MGGSGHNYLYDFEEEEEAVGAFTEADLKTSEKKSRRLDAEDFLVKSTPTRQSHKLREDSLNPYTNPNLDSDLSATIGKAKGNRK